MLNFMTLNFCGIQTSTVFSPTKVYTGKISQDLKVCIRGDGEEPIKSF